MIKSKTLPLLLYLLAALLFFPNYQYRISPDEICYLSVAQHYLNGDLLNAFNGYWSPLFSWILIPFLFLKVPPLLSLKLVSLLAGLLIIVSTQSFSDCFELNEPIKTSIGFMLVLIVLNYVNLGGLASDLLLVCLLLFYLSIIFAPGYVNGGFRGIICGLIGGLAYLTKSYAFVFFVLHFFICNVFFYIKNSERRKRIRIVRNLLSGLAVFLILSGTWITIISYKYNKITISTAGPFNYYVLAGPNPEIFHKSMQGFITPPNDKVFSIWEDPSYINVKSWSLIDSWHSFKHQLTIIGRNIKGVYSYFLYFSPLSIAILMAYALLCLASLEKPYFNNAFLSLGTIFLYIAGYLPIAIRDRYIMITHFIILMMGGQLLSFIHHTPLFRTKAIKFAALVLFVLGFTVLPIKDIMIETPSTANHTYVGRLNHALKTDYHVQGNCAANNNWWDMVTLSYLLKSRFYGIADPDWDENKLTSELKKNQIEYFFVWTSDRDPMQSLTDYHDITKGQLQGLKIYSRKTISR